MKRICMSGGTQRNTLNPKDVTRFCSRVLLLVSRALNRIFFSISFNSSCCTVCCSPDPYRPDFQPGLVLLARGQQTEEHFAGSDQGGKRRCPQSTHFLHNTTTTTTTTGESGQQWQPGVYEQYYFKEKTPKTTTTAAGNVG